MQRLVLHVASLQRRVVALSPLRLAWLLAAATSCVGAWLAFAGNVATAKSPDPPRAALGRILVEVMPLADAPLTLLAGPWIWVAWAPRLADVSRRRLGIAACTAWLSAEIWRAVAPMVLGGSEFLEAFERAWGTAIPPARFALFGEAAFRCALALALLLWSTARRRG